jgi:hypothetical protein
VLVSQIHTRAVRPRRRQQLEVAAQLPCDPQAGAHEAARPRGQVARERIGMAAAVVGRLDDEVLSDGDGAQLGDGAGAQLRDAAGAQPATPPP